MINVSVEVIYCFYFSSIQLKNSIMTSQSIALYDWNNGVLMMGFFALVAIILIAVLVIFMSNGNKHDDIES